MTKCLVFDLSIERCAGVFIPITATGSRFLLFIFLCRIYFKKAIFVTYKFCVDVGFLN